MLLKPILLNLFFITWSFCCLKLLFWVDEYGLGVRESLAEAVNAVISILGMQPCEGTDVVP